MCVIWGLQRAILSELFTIAIFLKASKKNKKFHSFNNPINISLQATQQIEKP